MDKPRARQGSKHIGSLWRVVSRLVFVLALAGWSCFLAPSGLHGPATYAIIDGHSMEPLLHTGDLAVARAHSPYGVGDLVMYRVDYGLVIHRIKSGSAAEGWITQGDNRDEPDPWTVVDDSIVGEYWFG